PAPVELNVMDPAMLEDEWGGPDPIADVYPDFAELMASIEKIKNLDLPTEDTIPMETYWHHQTMNLLCDAARHHLGKNSFVGGNMFVYFSVEQAEQVKREVADEVEAGIILPPAKRAFRGPDVFVVKHVDSTK